MRFRTAVRTLVALVALAGLTLGTMVSTSGPLAAAPQLDDRPCGELPDGVTTGLTYNNPETDAKDDIKLHLIELICGAELGSEIRVGAHYFGDPDLRKALTDKHAHDDVAVKVIVDGGAVQGDDEHGDYAEYEELLEVLGDDRGERSWVDYCRGETRACIGGGKDSREDALMHNKFFLFSATKGAENVVVQTSQNFRDGRSGTGMWNSAFTVADEASVYEHYKAYFDDLTKAAPKRDDYYEKNDLPQPQGDKYEVFHSPAAKENPIKDQLDRIDCTTDENTGGTKDGRTIVRVAMWMISGADWEATGTELARKLKQMDDQGCYIDIVADRIGTGAGAKDGPLEALLRKPKGKFHGPEVRKFYKGGKQPGLHSKDILVDGSFGGKLDQKVVLTGTHNLTWKSARVNDETTLVIKDAEAYEQYSDYFTQVRKKATLTYQTSKYKR